MNKVFETGVLGFGGENEVVEEVFGLTNKVYILSRCYFIILNIKFYNNYIITISYIYIYIYIYMYMMMMMMMMMQRKSIG